MNSDLRPHPASLIYNNKKPFIPEPGVYHGRPKLPILAAPPRKPQAMADLVIQPSVIAAMLGEALRDDIVPGEFEHEYID